jgi:hypothetical protein
MRRREVHYCRHEEGKHKGRRDKDEFRIFLNFTKESRKGIRDKMKKERTLASTKRL